MSEKTNVKLRELLKNTLAEFDTVEDFIFTTYNFDVQFFEEHIVSYLLGVPKIERICDLEAANRWISENHLCVYYDKNAVTNLDVSVTFPSYAVQVATGVFHPKVIIMYGSLAKSGEMAAYLFVSSANLTVSGYGRNLEGMARIQVTTFAVARSLRKFVLELRKKTGDEQERHKMLLSFLNRNKDKFSPDNSTRFFWNMGGGSKPWLIDELGKLAGNEATVVSPYFSDNLIALTDRLNASTVHFIPAVTEKAEGRSCGILRADYKALSRLGHTFSQIDDGRFAHVKMVQKGGYVVVGSHNFTEAAMEGKNAEASLIIKKSRENKMPAFQTSTMTAALFPKTLEDDYNGDGANERSSPTEYITVTIDWAERVVYVYAEGLTEECKLSVGSCPIVTLHTTDNLKHKMIPLSKLPELEQIVLKNKQFELEKRGRIILRGIINELFWKEWRPEIQCSSLEQALGEWYHSNRGDTLTGGGKDIKLTLLSDATEGEGELPAEHLGQDVFDDYFLTARTMDELIKAIEQAGVNIIALYRIFKATPGSMFNLLELTKKQGQGSDGVRIWMILNYLNFAAQQIGGVLKLFDGAPLEKPTFQKELKQFRAEVRKGIACYEKLFLCGGGEEDQITYLNWIRKEFGFGGRVNRA